MIFFTLQPHFVPLHVFYSDAIIRATRRLMVYESDFTGDESLYQRIVDLITHELSHADPNTTRDKQVLLEILNYSSL